MKICLGVNLLIGTENGLMLLDRSGEGKVYSLIKGRRFEQLNVLESQNILLTISGKRHDFTNLGELQGAKHFKIGNTSISLSLI